MRLALEALHGRSRRRSAQRGDGGAAFAWPAVTGKSRRGAPECPNNNRETCRRSAMPHSQQPRYTYAMSTIARESQLGGHQPGNSSGSRSGGTTQRQSNSTTDQRPKKHERAAPERMAPDAISPPITKPITLRTIAKWVKAGEKFACLTCYDATTARWLQQAGVPVLLVGDTAAEMILGLPGTIHAPLDFLITLTAAVKRGAPQCFV